MVTVFMFQKLRTDLEQREQISDEDPKYQELKELAKSLVGKNLLNASKDEVYMPHERDCRHVIRPFSRYWLYV